MSRIVITGGSGRLGRSVVQVLAAAGDEVISLDRAPRDLPGVRSVVCDLSDGQAAADCFSQLQPDAIVHLAAIAVPFGSPEPELYATNTSLAFHVLEAAVASGVGSVLFASSPTVIGYGSPTGWKAQYLPIDERHPRAPWNGYSLSKQAVEDIAAMAVRVHGDSLRVGVFRPCYVIAPEEWAGAPTQQGHTVRERLDSPDLSAVALFNYVDARDAGEFVHAWLRNAASIPNGSVFFVGAPDSLAREPVGDLIARYWPELAPLGGALPDDAALFSSECAAELIGWRARRTWRTELALDGVS